MGSAGKDGSFGGDPIHLLMEAVISFFSPPGRTYEQQGHAFAHVGAPLRRSSAAVATSCAHLAPLYCHQHVIFQAVDRIGTTMGRFTKIAIS